MSDKSLLASFYGSPSSSPSKKRRVKGGVDGTSPSANGNGSGSASSPALSISATRSPARASPRTPQGSRTRNTRPSVAGSPQSRSPSKRGPAATSGPTSLGPTSKFKLHFAGRVYRPLASASPKEARDMYTKEGNWIGQPDERSKENEELIDCPCGSQIDDETLMIQCEDCQAWQHARCVGFECEDDCPETFFCQDCAPRASGSSRRDISGSSMPSKRYEREYTPPQQTAPPLGTESARQARPSTPEPAHQRKRTPSPEAIRGDLPSDDGLEIEAASPLVSSILASPGSSRASAYRRGLLSSPSSPSASGKISPYAASRHALTQASISPLVKATAAHPLLTPTKSAKKRMAALNLGDDGAGDGQAGDSNGGASPSSSHLRAAEVPLPQHYQALLALHSAVERAILLHLATDGSRACSLAGTGSGTASASGPDGTGGTDEFHVELPNLVTYTAIRAVVERGSGRRFGPTELGQLVWLWEGGLHGAQAAEDAVTDDAAASANGRRGGLSISVGATRELDRSSGKKVYTWGLGIDLRVRQNVQLPAFEIVHPPSTVPASAESTPTRREPPSSPASAGKLKRQGMSVLPLWSCKADYRREEMRRRLGACVIKAHEDFARSSEATASTSRASASKKRASQDRPSNNAMSMSSPSAYTLPTPPSTARSQRGSHSCPTSSGHASSTAFARGFILDALPPIPAATLPALGPAQSSPIKRALTYAGGIASVDAEVAREDDVARARKKEALLDPQNAEGAGTGPGVSPVKRQMSLLERIKAKEEAAQAAAAQAAIEATAAPVPSGKAGAKAALMQAKSSLEAASLRARKKETRRAL